MHNWAGTAYGLSELGRDASTGNILDSRSECLPSLALNTEGGEVSSIASPLYLLASEIVDVVEFAAQYRAEENAAAEEGALIDASGYNDPATNPRFA